MLETTFPRELKKHERKCSKSIRSWGCLPLCSISNYYITYILIQSIYLPWLNRPFWSGQWQFLLLFMIKKAKKVWRENGDKKLAGNAFLQFASNPLTVKISCNKAILYLWCLKFNKTTHATSVLNPATHVSHITDDENKRAFDIVSRLTATSLLLLVISVSHFG